MIAAHNFGPETAQVTLKIADDGGELSAVDLLRDDTTKLTDSGTLELELGPYAARWLRIVSPTDRFLI